MPGTLEDTARRIGRARWLERRCFELLGGWVVSTPEPEAKLLFARQSHHHAWHAELFERVLPAANGFSGDATTAPPPTGWAALLDDVSTLSSTADRLVAAYAVVLPAKLDEYERWRDDADAVQDAPLLRWLRFVVTDEHADLAEGRGVLRARPDADAATARTSIEIALARAGSVLRGPG